MTILFEIKSLNDYSIAEFTVAKISFEKWIYEITTRYNFIELPIGESSNFKWELSQDGSCYKMRYLNSFDVCWNFFLQYKKWYEELKYFKKNLENFNKVSEKRMKMSEDEYRNYLESSTINYYYSDEYLRDPSYEHISYEDYISSYE